jgi:hypothetical protein
MVVFPMFGVGIEATGHYSAGRVLLYGLCAHCGQEFNREGRKKTLRKPMRALPSYFVPITTLKNVGGSGCNSLLRYPEFRSIC